MRCQDCQQPLDELHDWKRHPACLECSRPTYSGYDCAYCAFAADLAERAARAERTMLGRGLGRTRTWEELEADELADVKLDRLDGRLY